MFILDYINALPPIYQLMVIGSVFAGGGGIYLLVKSIMYHPKPEAETETVNEEDRNKEPNTIVIDQVKGWLHEYIPWGDNPPARQWKEGEKYYYMVKRPRGIKFDTPATALKYVVLTHAEQWAADGVITKEEEKEKKITPEILWLALIDNYSPIVWASAPPKWANGIQKGMVLIAIGLFLLIVIMWGKGPTKAQAATTTTVNPPAIVQTK